MGYTKELLFLCKPEICFATDGEYELHTQSAGHPLMVVHPKKLASNCTKTPPATTDTDTESEREREQTRDLLCNKQRQLHMMVCAH